VNKRQRATLKAIFDRPDNKNIRWDDFIKMLLGLGAEVTEKGGSMVGVRLNGHYAVFHRPHPENLIYLSLLKSIRRYLLGCGVDPQE
jgi:hypothetical protein